MSDLTKKWNTTQKTLVKSGFILKREDEGEYDKDPDMIRRQIHMKSRLETANKELKTPIQAVSLSKVSPGIVEDENAREKQSFIKNVQFKPTVTVVAFYESDDSFDDQSEFESVLNLEKIQELPEIEVKNEVEVLSAPPIPPKHTKPNGSKYESSHIDVAPQPQGNLSAFINDSKACSAITSDVDWNSNISIEKIPALTRENLPNSEFQVSDQIMDAPRMGPSPGLVGSTRKSFDDPRSSRDRGQEFVIVDSEPVVIPQRNSSLGLPNAALSVNIPPRSRSLNRLSTPISAH